MIRQLPAAPLRELIERRTTALDAADPTDYHRTPVNSGARNLLSMSSTRLKLVFERETVRWDVADRICCRLGVHPTSVYGPDWTAIQ